MPGVVSITHWWGHDPKGVQLSVARKNPGVSINDITDNSVVDNICGNGVFSAYRLKSTGYKLVAW